MVVYRSPLLLKAHFKLKIHKQTLGSETSRSD